MRRVKKKTKKKERTSELRLSQCMIVKNEEKNIQRALSWGKEFMWEQIVVDTGSTDRTAELAKEMGAKVFVFPWINDFSAAKNYAIEQASGDWIAFLDADEYFSPEDAKKIIPLLCKYHRNRDADFIRSKIAHLNKDGEIIEVSSQDRIFRNDAKLRYRYRIHEELYHKEKKYLGMINAEDQLMILHTGYNESIEKDLEKSKRNIQLLEQNLEENPKNAMCIMYLGDAYGMGGRVADSLNCYRRVVNDPDLEITDEYAVFRSGIQVLKLLSKAPEYGTEKEFFEISSKLRDRGHDLHPDVDYYEGCWHWKNQELETTAIYFEHALKKLEQYKGGDTIQLSAELEMVNCIIASAALKQGNLQKAVQFAVTTLRLNKYSAEALRTLLNAFSREYQAGTDVEVYWTFLCKIYDINNLKDLIFIHRIAGDTDFAAIQECVLRIVPSEIGNQILSES